jgi:hypothetical protein
MPKSRSSANADQPERDQPIEAGLVAGERADLLDRRRRRPIIAPRFAQRLLQAEDVGEILAVLPRVQHLGNVRSRVPTAEHRADELEPGEVGVVVERDPTGAAGRRQQPAVLVGAHVAGRHARRAGEIVNAVLAHDPLPVTCSRLGERYSAKRRQRGFESGEWGAGQPAGSPA